MGWRMGELQCSWQAVHHLPAPAAMVWWPQAVCNNHVLPMVMGGGCWGDLVGGGGREGRVPTLAPCLDARMHARWRPGHRRQHARQALPPPLLHAHLAPGVLKPLAAAQVQGCQRHSCQLGQAARPAQDGRGPNVGGLAPSCVEIPPAHPPQPGWQGSSSAGWIPRVQQEAPSRSSRCGGHRGGAFGGTSTHVWACAGHQQPNPPPAWATLF